MPRVHVFCGPSRSSRAGRIDALIREHWGRALLITPAQAYAARRQDALLATAPGQGVWGKPARAFTDFVAWLIAAEGIPVRRVTDAERRMLLDRCLRRIAAHGGIAGVSVALDNPGLAAHLLQVIAQLKQAAIEPAEFRARLQKAKESSPLDPLVAAAYTDYQQALLDVRVYDVPGLYWEAVTRCDAGCPRALASTDLLAFDGFDDFTPSEFRLIEALSKHVEDLVIGLNCDLRPDRRDCFALSIAAAARLESTFKVTPIQMDPPPPRRFSEYAAAAMFWRDPPEFPEALAADLTALPCADVEQEIESIARRVKRLLLDGAATPDRIAVVCRNLAETAPLLRSIFAGAGVPARISSAPRLTESVIGAFLLRLFDAAQHWEREAVTEALLSPCFPAPDTPETALARGALASLARAARIIAGREEWQARLGSLRARIAAPKDESARALLRRMPDAAQALDGALALVEAFAALTGRFASTATQREYAAALDALLLEVDTRRVMDTFPGAVFRDAQRNARDALGRLLESLADACDSAPIAWPLFLERLEQGMRETDFVWPAPPGAVLCCDPLYARNLSFDYVFFGGLAEGVMPMPAPANAVYPEADRARLRAAEIPMEGRSEHSARERLLFYHALQAADKGVTLSWPLLRPGGRETVPSQFLAELLELFEGHADIAAPMPLSDCFVPRPAEAASWRELRNSAFFHHPELGAAFPDAFALPARALRIEARRHGKEPFDAFDGMLEAPALDDAARRFGPEHCFSVNQLETYVGCPFRFFAARLLRVEEEETPDEAMDPILRGLILHETLQRFHERFHGAPLGEVFAAPDAEAVMMESLDAAFAAHAWRNAAASHALTAMERAHMAAALRRYIVSEAEREEPWRAAYFEYAFGPSGGEHGADAARRSDPFMLDTDAGPVRLSGRMDRVDQQDAALRVVDYKTGVIPGSGQIISGESLQLTIYAWALERYLFPEATKAEALYISVGKGERLDALGHSARYKALWEPRERNAMRAIAGAVRGIRAGAFPPHPTKYACAYCEYRTACRFDQARIEYKTGSPWRVLGKREEEDGHDE